MMCKRLYCGPLYARLLVYLFKTFRSEASVSVGYSSLQYRSVRTKIMPSEKTYDRNEHNTVSRKELRQFRRLGQGKKDVVNK